MAKATGLPSLQDILDRHKASRVGRFYVESAEGRVCMGCVEDGLECKIHRGVTIPLLLDEIDKLQQEVNRLAGDLRYHGRV